MDLPAISTGVEAVSYNGLFARHYDSACNEFDTNIMARPYVNRSSQLVVALIIHAPCDDNRLLVVKRPDSPSEDLPGVWGLPAASLRPGENPYATAYRIGLEKLGSPLTVGRWVISGYSRKVINQTMYLFEAHLHSPQPELPDWSKLPVGTTLYTEWQWAPVSILEAGAHRGSLCCSLFLSKGVWQES